MSNFFPSAETVPEDALVVALFLAALGAIWWWAWIKQRDELWVPTIRRVCSIILLALATQLPFSLYYDRVNDHSFLLLLLQLAKDGPGLLLVALMADIVARKSTTLAAQDAALAKVLEACPRVFLCGFALAAICGLIGGAPEQLEGGISTIAVLYRALIFGPMALYCFLIFALFAGDALTVGRIERSLRRRFALFSAGAFTWVMLAADHLVRPSLSHGLGVDGNPGVIAAANVAEGFLWTIMATFWVYGYVSGRKVARADFGLALIDSYRARSTRVAARLTDPRSRWRKQTSGWQTRMTELADTERELCDESPETTGGDVEYHAQKTQTAYAMLAFLAYETSTEKSRPREELLALRLLQKFARREISDGSPAKVIVDRDPIAAVVEPVLRLDDARTRSDLRSERLWVQLTALLAAEADLLPAHKSRSILDPRQHDVSQDVRRALKDVRFDLSRRRAS